MRLLVSDDTGLTKSVSVEENKTLDVFGEQKKGMLVSALTYVPELAFVTGHEDSNIRVNLLTDKNYRFETQLTNESPIVSLQYHENVVYSTQANGEVSATNIQYEDDHPYFDESKIVYTVNSEGTNNARLNSFEKSQLLVLSKETNPQVRQQKQLIDLNKGELKWKAKNVKNDDYDLKVPINDTDCAFKSKNEVYVSTAYRKIRLYDVRVKNCKPTIDHKDSNDKFHFNNILLKGTDNTQYVIVSDVAGGVYMLDPRKDFRIVGKFKGAKGSVRKMALSETSPYLVTVSLDRFARVYNTNNMKLYQEIFLKQKLTNVSIIDEKLDSTNIEKKMKNQLPVKKWQHQNTVKENAISMRQKIKQNRLLLTFQKNKAVKTEEGKREFNPDELAEEYEYEQDEDYNDAEGDENDDDYE